jgi:anthranilate synthase component II
MIILLDNYDSFTFNLVQLAGSICENIKVVRNDEMTVQEIKSLNPSHIIISPGPGYPADAGICENIVQEFKGVVPILGVCLGHQGICESFGASIALAKQLMHGKQSNIHILNDSPIFRGLPSVIQAARYHSLIVQASTLPSILQIIAYDDNNEIMAVKHKNHQIYGLQFHPESILTPDGYTIIKNFLMMSGKSVS